MKADSSLQYVHGDIRDATLMRHRAESTLTKCTLPVTMLQAMMRINRGGVEKTTFLNARRRIPPGLDGIHQSCPDFEKVRRLWRKSDDFGDFRTDFLKVVRKCEKLSVFLQSRPEIEKAGRKFRKSAGNFNFCLTFSGVARLF